MTPTLCFLLDVDNTLLDNDHLKSDIAARLESAIGEKRSRRFWELYEQVRAEQDYVDFPRTIQLLSSEEHDPALARTLHEIIDNWPFKEYLYPHTLETIRYLRTLGRVVILSDGDSVFQPLKIRKSGLEDAVLGHVLVYVHKERELGDVFARYPADHYVAVDDKPRITSALERECPSTFTTVLVLQGKYARPNEFQPPPDYVVAHIGDLRGFSRDQFLSAPQSSAR